MMNRAKEIGKSTMSTNVVRLRYYHDSIEIRDIFKQRADFKLIEGLDIELTCSGATIGFLSTFMLFNNRCFGFR